MIDELDFKEFIDSLNATGNSVYDKFLLLQLSID